MKKIYKKLTEEQIKRGVIFTSTLSIYRFETTEDTTHEVLTTDNNKYSTIDRLKEDKFFNKSRWKYNILRC